MKLNWFSPLPPASTDIAHYTMRVLPALTEHAEVTLWTDQERWDASLKKYAKVRQYHPQRISWEELNRADVSLYHIGNNPLFHGAIWQLSRQHSGVVVLHDIRLHHFFDGLYRVQWRNLNAYLAMMETYYGEQGRLDAAECYKSEARNIDEMAERYPLTRLAVENALGVMVHTRDAFDNLNRESGCPVAYAPLPFSAGLDSERQSNSINLSGGNAVGPIKRVVGPTSRLAGPPFRLIVFGYLGRNRRLDSLLKALAQFPQREQFYLDIYGEVLDDNKHLRAEIRALGLKRLVSVHGFVPEAELDHALASAHLAVNLRYPTMGEASGSQLRIWAHSLPSLVTQVGWYATLPANTVAFVRPSHEIEDVQSHLSAFLAAPESFAKKGEKGRQILEQQHAPEIYAQSVIDFVATAQGWRIRAVAHQLAQRAGTLMSDWLEPKSRADNFQRVAAEIYALTKGRKSRARRQGAE